MGCFQTSRMHRLVSLAKVVRLPEEVGRDAGLEGGLWLESGTTATLPDQLKRPADACPMGTMHDRHRKVVNLVR